MRITGELDIATAPQLRRGLADQLDPPPRMLVIDLRGVSFLGISAALVLGEIQQATSRTGTHLRLVSEASAMIRRPLQHTGLLPHLEVFPDPGSALRP